MKVKTPILLLFIILFTSFLTAFLLILDMYFHWLKSGVYFIYNETSKDLITNEITWVVMEEIKVVEVRDDWIEVLYKVIKMRDSIPIMSYIMKKKYQISRVPFIYTTDLIMNASQRRRLLGSEVVSFREETLVTNYGRIRTYVINIVEGFVKMQICVDKLTGILLLNNITVLSPDHKEERIIVLVRTNAPLSYEDFNFLNLILSYESPYALKFWIYFILIFLSLLMIAYLALKEGHF